MSETAISCYGITRSFGARKALDEVSLEIARGTVTCLIGPNGSGKSTLLKALAGILPVDSGVIKIGTNPLIELGSSERASRVVYVGAELRAEFPMTAEECASLGAFSSGTSGRDRVEWAMDACGASALRDRDLATLSGGERQLVALSRALVQGGKVLLLDEALSKMDLHHQAKAGALLRSLAAEKSYTVLLVAHDLNLACEWADSAVLLSRGKLVAHGAIASTVTSARMTELYPGAPIAVGKSPATGAVKVFFGANPVTNS